MQLTAILDQHDDEAWIFLSPSISRSKKNCIVFLQNFLQNFWYNMKWFDFRVYKINSKFIFEIEIKLKKKVCKFFCKIDLLPGFVDMWK